MKDYIWVILALFGFALVACIIAFQDFNVWMWLAGMYMVCMSFRYATTFTETTHSWLCAYSFQGGTGRMFIQANQTKLTKDFVRKVDEYITKTNPELGNVFVYNMQYLGRIPV